MLKFAYAALAAVLATVAVAQTTDDPYLWLEDINGARAVAQVKQWNQATEDLLTHSAAYDSYRQRALDILNDEQQIAEPEAVLGDEVTNHWVDAKNPRGLWRIASLSSYVAGKPQWRTLIDVDALGKARARAGCGMARSASAPNTTAASSRSAPAGPMPTWCVNSTFHRASSSPAGSACPMRRRTPAGPTPTMSWWRPILGRAR